MFQFSDFLKLRIVLRCVLLFITLMVSVLFAVHALDEQSLELRKEKRVYVTELPEFSQYSADLPPEGYQEFLEVQANAAEGIASMGAIAELIQAELRDDRVVTSTGN